MSGVPDAVCWHEGMQLLPQHFQLQGLRAEALSAQLSHAANPWFWGVTELDLDPIALTAGRVRVLGLNAILPDGLPVQLSPGVDAPLELDIAAALEASGSAALTLYLAINPLWRAGQLVPLKGRLQSVVGAALPDLASGEYPEPITVWRANPRLVPEAQRADAICLPLLKVGKEGGGYVQLPYVAPTPRLLPESPLGRQVISLCSRAREKCVFLAGRLRHAQQAGNDDDIDEIRRQLTALWLRLPEVEAALNSRIASPAALYGLLTGMAGSWCALDLLAGVPAFPALDYLDLQKAYGQVLAWLNLALERVRAGYRSLPFEQEGPRFSILLPDLQSRRQRLVIGLRMPAGSAPDAAGQWLSRAVIASAAHVPTLVRQRMSGLSHQAMSRQEQVAYGVGDDTRLFVLQAAGEWFDPAQPLHLVATQGNGPWQVVLFVAAETEVA